MRTHPVLTLTELLVTLIVVAFAAGLLLPAAADAREAAARKQCENNLKQVGQAILGYERQHKQIPPLGTYRPPISMLKHGWVAHTLPYLDQNTLAEKYRWDVDYSHPGNQPVIKTQLKVLQCPATPRSVWTISGNDGNPYEAAVGDYSACNNVRKEAATMGYPPDASRRAMFNGEITPRGTTLAEVTDGLSQTMMVLEQAGKPDWYINGKKQPKPAPQPERAAWGHHAQFGLLLAGHSSDGLTEPGPCAINCTNNRGVYSFHPGVVNVVFADGSVHSLRDGTSVWVLFALNTIDGAEVINADDF